MSNDKPQHNPFACGPCFCEDCDEARRMAREWSKLMDRVLAGEISLEEANRIMDAIR